MTQHRHASSLRGFRLLASLFGFLLCAALVSATSVNFDIPAQPAADALKRFVKQSGQKVMFNSDELKGISTREVKGDMEPADALNKLLDGSGFAASMTSNGSFIVTKSEKPKDATGSVRGNLARETGSPAEGVKVIIRETGQQSRTDRNGEYSFSSVEPGSYLLVATAEGYQPLHITDVVVKAGYDLSLGKEEMHVADSKLTLEPFVVHAEAVTQLEKFEVTGAKEKPFSTANVDVPRTVDDAQPYYIFDSKTIDQSGATNIEDFLKQRLTMNTTALTNSQNTGTTSIIGHGGIVTGNTSSINLRGLGTDKTLVLVNGRRMANVTSGDGAGATSFQPDLNGIPLSAIDRIEVLPSSASGIYGGSAIGGVVNVILKKEYAGGEIRLTYDNTWDTDSPARTVAATYGLTLEGGRTHLLLSASWTDAQPLLLQDRREIFERNLATVLRNAPDLITSNTVPFLGSLVNVTPTRSSAQTLTLKDGGALGSRNTFVSAGTSSSISIADLSASLKANAGTWDFSLPASTQAPTGLLRPFGVTPETRSIQASVRREMAGNIEAFADFSYGENRSKSVFNPNFSSYLIVPADSLINPFTTAVRIRVPDATQVPVTSESTTENFVAGVIAKLPFTWTGEVDYSRAESHFSSRYSVVDDDALSVDLTSGVLNPFVDTLLYPLSLDRYLVPRSYDGRSTLDDFAFRAAGPLWSLPWGAPNLVFGLERRIENTPRTIYEEVFPLTPAANKRVTTFARRQITDSLYVEGTFPLVKRDWIPTVHSLELQLSGRSELFTVSTGTPYHTEYPNNPENSFYASPTQNDQPYFSEARYTSTNWTAALKYQPVADVTLRASLATAFLPPVPAQLIKNPVVDDFTSTLTDPKTGSLIDVQTISGGNPNLKPEISRSLNVGVIWEPQTNVLKGLRLDAEYYRIEQHNYIGSLSPQQIVELEGQYPQRVRRDSSGSIVLVDTSLMNLYKLETEGWDLSGDYTLKTGIGIFNLRATESIILHLKNQYEFTLPEYEAAGYHPSEGGAPKYKSNVTLSWEWAGWSAAWSTRYFGAYKQYGAAGGPFSTQNLSGAAYAFYLDAQGGDTVPSQMYHDIFLGYTFGKRGPRANSRLARAGAGLLDELTIQVGVKNVFGKVPPFDVYYDSNYYLSPYGDMRLRGYWLSIRKQF